jgi:hypothetical protein
MYLIRDRQYNQCYTPLAFFLRRYPQCNINNTRFFHRAFPSRSSCATWAASPFAQHGILTTTKRQIKALTETALGPQLFQQCSGLLEVYRVKALREPAVDLRQQLSGCCELSLTLPEPSEAQRGAPTPCAVAKAINASARADVAAASLRYCERMAPKSWAYARLGGCSSCWARASASALCCWAWSAEPNSQRTCIIQTR